MSFPPLPEDDDRPSRPEESAEPGSGTEDQPAASPGAAGVGEPSDGEPTPDMPSSGAGGGQAPPPPPPPPPPLGNVFPEQPGPSEAGRTPTTPPPGAGQYPPPTFGAAPGPTGQPPAAAKTDTGAITALVLSIIGLLICGPLSVVGLILGFTAKNRLDQPGATTTGSGLATAAIAVGGIGTAVWLLLLLFAFGS